MAGAALALALLAACGGPSERADERPSIVLVSIDTLRADHVGAYGYERDTTPFLDRLAREGVLFERALSPVSWTLPAHMTMLSGLYPVQHGVTREDAALSPDATLVAERLQAAGYRTIGLFFPGYIHARFGFERGFDVFRSHRDAEEAEVHLMEELERLARSDDERPFFLFLHLFDVHSKSFTPDDNAVYRSPEPYHDMFLPGAEERLPDVPALSLWRGEVALEDAELEALVALYDGGVRYVDAKLEAWFGELGARGLLDGALVVVTADHGEALGQRDGRLEGHGGFFQEGLHVPLILRLPGAARAGERVSEVVSLADVAPTLLGFAGLAPDPAQLGCSLLEPVPADRVVTGSRGEREYFVRWPKKYLGSRGIAFGYDLEADPRERERRRIPAEAFERVRAELLDGARLTPPVDAAPAEAGALEALRDLGYVGDTLDE